MSEAIPALLIGAIAGTATGLIPGVHANTIAILFILSPIEKNLNGAIFITSMSITHSITDSIPNILLGAATETGFLSLLPGQKMLLEGKGIEAIKITALGAITTTLISLPLLLPFLSLAKNYISTVQLLIPAILTGTLFLMVKSENNKKIAIICLALAGILGIITLNSPIKNPVFALITGFFAVPGLIHTITTKTMIPEQKESDTKISAKHAATTSIVSGIISIIPGIGPSQAATIMKNFSKIKTKEYLLIIGGLNTANIIFSILMLHTIQKTRTGTAIALSNIPMQSQELLILIISAAASAGIGGIITIKTAKIAIKAIKKINYRIMSGLILTGLIGMTYYLSGAGGIIGMVTAAAINWMAIKSNVKRSHAMNFLLFPSLLYYTGISI